LKFLENPEDFLISVVGINQPLYNFIFRLQYNDMQESLSDLIYENNKEQNDIKQAYADALGGKCFLFSQMHNETYPQLFLSLLGIPNDNVAPFGYIGDGAPPNSNKEWLELFENHPQSKKFLDMLITFATKHIDKNGQYHIDEMENRIDRETAKHILLNSSYTAFG
jgi:hypothetical protein